MKRMTIKASLLALCAGAAFIPALHAQAAATFNPASGWNVKQAPFSAAGGAQSCTVMTRFDNGFSMQMTGSANGVNNLSIDVRQPAFQAGGIMDATLSTSGVSQNVQAQAYGNSLLVINMDNQKSLLAAMRKGGTLNFKLAGNEFNFNLSGLDDAAAHFDQCVGGNNVFGTAPATQQAMAAPVTPVESAPVQQPRPAPAMNRTTMENPPSEEAMRDTMTSKGALAQITKNSVAPPSVPPSGQIVTDKMPTQAMVNNGGGRISVPPPADEMDDAGADETAYANAAPVAPRAVKPAAMSPVAPAPLPMPVANKGPRPMSEPEVKQALAMPPPSSNNLVAHKVPELPPPQAQPDAQDMERMEKQKISGDFNPDEEFATVPVQEIAPPPPPMQMDESQDAKADLPLSDKTADVRPVPAPVKPMPVKTAMTAPIEKAPLAMPPARVAPVEKVAPSMPVPAVVSAPPSAPVKAAAVPAVPVANPVANPPLSGRYERPKMATATAVTPPRETKTAFAETVSKPPADVIPAVKPEDEAAWDAIPAPDKAPPAPVKPMPVKEPEVSKPPVVAPPVMKESDDADFKPDVTDLGDGRQQISSPPPKVERSVQTVRADLTKEGLDDADEDQDDHRAMPPSNVSPSNDPAAQTRIADLEQTIAKLRSDNAMLDEDLKSSLKESHQETTSISSDNWNLEKAAMRYNEAEREIQRLGRQLQLERSTCTQDKKDIEGQLFDPAVTDQKQIAKLSELQEQLDTAQTELSNQRRTYEERIQALQEQLNKK